MRLLVAFSIVKLRRDLHEPFPSFSSNTTKQVLKIRLENVRPLQSNAGAVTGEHRSDFDYRPFPHR
jgi:hypothetical protein